MMHIDESETVSAALGQSSEDVTSIQRKKKSFDEFEWLINDGPMHPKYLGGIRYIAQTLTDLQW